MPSSLKKSPSTVKTNKSKSSPKITSLMTSPSSSKTKTSSIKLDNIPDDILVIILNRLDILHLIKIYLTKTT